MEIYYLLILLIGIFFIVYLINKDFFAPTSILCESYILAVFLASLNVKKWNIELSAKCISIIIVGILVFAIISLYIYLFFKKCKIKEIKEYKYIQINKFNLIVLIIIQIFTLVMNFYYVHEITGGINGFSQMLSEYRHLSAYGDDATINLPIWVNQLLKLSKATTYILIYVVIYNFLISKKQKQKGECYLNFGIFSSIIYIIISIMSGGRFGLITFFIYCLMIFVILDMKLSNIHKIEKKNVLKIIGAIVLILFVFSATRGIIGRTNESKFLDYISLYFGGSIQLFDLYLNDNTIDNNTIFGQEIFYGINRLLSKFGVIEPYEMHLEFRSSNGIIIGNVYTAFRNMIHDFGFTGVVVIQIILSIFWNVFYQIIKRKEITNEIDISIILYCTFINTLFLHSYREMFFSTIVTFSTIINIIIHVLVIVFLTKIHIFEKRSNI